MIGSTTRSFKRHIIIKITFFWCLSEILFSLWQTPKKSHEDLRISVVHYSLYEWSTKTTWLWAVILRGFAFHPYSGVSSLHCKSSFFECLLLLKFSWQLTWQLHLREGLCIGFATPPVGGCYMRILQPFRFLSFSTAGEYPLMYPW